MKAVGRYDSALQMFVEEPREPDMKRLSFLRWLAEGRRLEHRIAGRSSGEFAVDLKGSGPEDDGGSGGVHAAYKAREGGATAQGGLFMDGVQPGNPERGVQTLGFRGYGGPERGR